MTSVTLSMKAVHHRCRPTVAWRLPGASVDRWLAELSVEHVAMEGLRYCLLPQVPGGASVSGILVISDQPLPEAPSPMCIQYGCEGANVYVPVDAEFHPPVTESELEQLFGDRVVVYEPTRGFIAIADDQVSVIGSLVRIPPAEPVVWDDLSAGVHVNQRLDSLESEIMDSDTLINAMGPDDPDRSPFDLEPLPNEPDDHPVARAGRGLRRSVRRLLFEALGGLARLTDSGRRRRYTVPLALAGVFASGLAGIAMGGVLLPTLGVAGMTAIGAGLVLGRSRDNASSGTAGGQRGWTDRWSQKLTDWADRQRRLDQEALEFERHRELHRLLHALDTDPDQGLSYALPLSGLDSTGRGVAEPGSGLTHRRVDFSLDALSPVGPVDSWQVSWRMRQQLIQRYEQLAGEAEGGGDYRRAAYVFAHLLEDFNRAAEVLVRGSHYGEAAVLYEHRLDQPAKAAACFEQAGRMRKAIELYRRVGMYHKVGDLLMTLDDEQGARQAYDQAIDQWLAEDEPCKAARCCVEQLHDRTRAKSILAQAWDQDSRYALACGLQLFELYAEDGEQVAANQWIDRHVQQIHHAQDAARLSTLFSQIAGRYPDQQVKGHLVQVTSRLVADHLGQASGMVARKLADALVLLHPNDRLLGRDVQRYLQQHRSTGARNKTPCNQLKTKRLPDAVHWHGISALEEGWLAYGTTENADELVLVIGDWDCDSLVLRHRRDPEHGPIQVAVCRRGRYVMISAGLCRPLNRAIRFGFKLIIDGFDRPLAMAGSRLLSVWSLFNSLGVTQLQLMDQHAHVLKRFPLPSDRTLEAAHVLMDATGRNLYISVDSELWQMMEDQQCNVLHSGEGVIQAMAVMRRPVGEWVIVFQDGEVRWLDLSSAQGGSASIYRIANDSHCRLSATSQHELLYVGSNENVELFALEATSVTHLGLWRGPGVVTGLACRGKSTEVAVLLEDDDTGARVFLLDMDCIS